MVPVRPSPVVPCSLKATDSVPNHCICVAAIPCCPTGDPGKRHDWTQGHAGLRPECGGKNVPQCAKVDQKCVLRTTDYLTIERKNSQLKKKSTLEIFMTQTIKKRSLFSKYWPVKEKKLRRQVPQTQVTREQRGKGKSLNPKKALLVFIFPSTGYLLFIKRTLTC